MTSAVAILALALSGPLPYAYVQGAERVPLAPPADAVTLRIHPFDRTLELVAPKGSLPALARSLRGSSNLCPQVEERSGSVVLRCKTPKIRANLDKQGGKVTLDLRAITIYPWRPEEDGPPFVRFRLEELGLEECPGTTSPEVRGECLLAEGRLEEARQAFLDALARGPSAAASLRMGDLALADDDLERAREHWRRARAVAPWGRLAQARLCEVEPTCLNSRQRAAFFDESQADPALRPDLLIRRLHLQMMEGDKMGPLQALAGEMGEGGACTDIMPWCRRFLLEALQRGGEDGAVALAMYLELPDRMSGPGAMELLRIAAGQAEAAGAPIFAANLLAAVTAQIPKAELPAHLLRLARLFLAGGDRVRADEIATFAKTQLPAAAWKRDGWPELQRRARQPAPPPEPSRPDVDPDVAAARSAVESARLLLLSPGARP